MYRMCSANGKQYNKICISQFIMKSKSSTPTYQPLTADSTLFTHIENSIPLFTKYLFTAIIKQWLNECIRQDVIFIFQYHEKRITTAYG